MSDLLINFDTNDDDRTKFNSDVPANESSNQLSNDDEQPFNNQQINQSTSQQTDEQTTSLIDNRIDEKSRRDDLITADIEESSIIDKAGDKLDNQSNEQHDSRQSNDEANRLAKSRQFKLVNSSTDRLTDEDRSDESLESKENPQKRKVLKELNQKLIHEQKINGELISKLHNQLDNAITEKEELIRKLNEKDRDITDIEKIIKAQKDKLTQLEDVESTNSKLKALAIKLKKELAEVKENVHSKDGGDKAIKDQLKQQILNFNNLQKEYDRLHDEYESAKKKIKSFENDLTLTLRELNAVKTDLSNLKVEFEKTEKKCQQSEQHLNEENDRNKELSSKIIILNNKLDEERKKTQNLSTVEKQVNKLTSRLDSKQNEINEINKKLKHLDETNSDLVKIKEEHQLLQALNESLEAELGKLKNENQELINSTNNKYSEFESIISENNNLQVTNSQLTDELTNLKRTIEHKDKDFNTDLEDLKKKLMIAEQQLSNKDAEYNSYKIKVTKVLNERNNSRTNDETHLKELSSLKRQLDESMEHSAQFQNELHNEKQMRTAFETELNGLKADLTRYKDDSSKLVIQRNENESLKTKIAQLEHRAQSIGDRSTRQIEELQDKHSKEIEQYEMKIRELMKVNDELRSRELNESNEILKEDKNEFKNQSNSDNTDLDSLENTSINSKQKRLSTSTVPDLDYVNPLQEILNQNNSKTVKAELLDQLNELLKESESNNSLLTEQNRLLKEEVRRLERSIERTEITKNLEYFKNVLIKFLSFENNTSDGSERNQLVPVLKTILKLSKEEEMKLKNFTKFMQDSKQFHSQQQSNGKSSWSWWN